MSANPVTKFDLDDRVRIIGPAAAPVTTDFTGRTGTIADVWGALGEYIVVVDGLNDAWIFPETSLAHPDTTAKTDVLELGERVATALASQNTTHLNREARR